MDIFPTFSFFLTNLSSVFSTFMDKTPPKQILSKNITNNIAKLRETNPKETLYHVNFVIFQKFDFFTVLHNKHFSPSIYFLPHSLVSRL